MTDLLSHPLLRSPSTDVPPRPGPLSAALGALCAAGGGLVVCLALAVAGWFAGSSGTAADAVRAGADAWLLGHGAGIAVPGAHLTALPLGITLAAGFVLWRIGAWVADSSGLRNVRSAAVATGVLSVVYAGFAAVTAALVAVPQAQVGVVRGGVGAFLVAVAFGGAGILRAAGLWASLSDRLPEWARSTMVGAACGVMVMLGIAATVLAAALLRGFSDGATVWQGLGPGTVGGAVLLLAQLALLPNAVLCTGAYLAGPGFSVGAGTAVAPGGVVLGHLPAVPLLAALPDPGAGSWATQVLVALPLLAGAAASVLALRRFPVYGFDVAAVRGSLTGAATGVAFGLLTVAATGAVGPGRMATVGPHVWDCVAVCPVACAVGGVVAAMVVAWRQRRT